MNIQKIAASLGGGKETRVDDGWLTCCPCHEDTNPSLSIKSGKDGELIVHCHTGCDWKNVKDAIRAKGLLPPEKQDLPTFIWNKSSRNDHVIKKYFSSRNININQIPECLRLNKHHGQVMMVSAVTREGDDEPVAIHRTFLDKDYKKTDRKMLGKCGGRAVWLSNPAEKMLIGEGIETTLAAMVATGLPGGACLSASGMKKVVIPKRVKKIIILVDSDPNQAGQDAAKALAARFTGEVMFATPDDSCFTDKPKKLDFNDLEPDQIRERFELLVEKQEEEQSKEESEGKCAAQLIIETVNQNATLYHDPDDTPFARYNYGGHKELWSLESKQFQRWAGRTMYKKHGMVPNKNALSDAFNVLAGQAIYDGAEIDIFVRVAVVDGNYYLDLCLDDWRIVKIEPGRWQITTPEDAGVAFRRTSTMRDLPIPENCSSEILPELLIKHFNMSEAHARLAIAYLIECLMPDTEYPVMEITGSPGSGKSTIQEMIRDCIDPNKVNLRAAPKTIEDIFVSAINNHLVSYNNLSRITAGQSDALCNLSTGGGHAGRKFYTNTDETATDVKKPVILNGIGHLAKMPDLIDRLLKITLQPITSNKSKKRVMESFNKDRPMILGSLLDLFSRVLELLPEIKLDRPPRMADFAELCQAITHVYSWEKSLLQIYYENRSLSFEDSLESSPAIMAVVNIVNDQGSYNGLVGDLFKEIESRRQDNDPWVKTARGLGEKLRLHTPALKAVGIKVDFDPVRHNDGYHVNLTKMCDEDGKQHSRRTRPTQNNYHEQADRERCVHREHVIPSPSHIDEYIGTLQNPDIGGKSTKEGVIDGWEEM